jgi:pentatricopeptide repeat protein
MCVLVQAGVRPNVRTYTALITALGNAKQWSRALELLQSLKSDTSGTRVEPNAYTYSALLKTMGEHGQWKLAEQVCIHADCCVAVAGC